MTVNLFVFGATGDLFKRKIYPAIKELGMNLNLFALGRKDLTTKQFIEQNFPQEDISIEYVKIDYSSEEDYKKIFSLLGKENIFYLSTPPKIFKEFLENIKNFNLENIKIAFEKPFGVDKKSFDELEKLLKSTFKEKQVYLVDHYLGKKGVMNITEFRKKGDYEKYWNSKHLKKIRIVAKEEIGVEGRVEYYEEMGAIKDMVQNHLLQILLSATSNLFDEGKQNLLKKIKIKDVFLGQYEGYRKEIGKKSNTETFAKLNLEIKTPEWKGTEMELITGKKLDKKETKVVVEFFEKESLPKKIVFEIYPKERICIEDKEYFCNFEEKEIKNSYVNILKKILSGEKDIFPKIPELRESWEIVGNIDKKQSFVYKEGSNEEEAIKQNRP